MVGHGTADMLHWWCLGLDAGMSNVCLAALTLSLTSRNQAEKVMQPASPDSVHGNMRRPRKKPGSQITPYG